MKNITKENRGLVFLAAIMIIGVLAVSYIAIRDQGGVVNTEDNINTFPKKSFDDFNNKIENLKYAKFFDPTSYNTLITEIDASYKQKLITKDAESQLKSNLYEVYSGLIYYRCEFYLAGNSLDSGNNLLNWLKQLENIAAKNSKIDFYKAQINAFNYYSKTLPNKVSNFISPGIGNYEQNIYDALIIEVTNMPKLNSKYKNTQKLNIIRKKTKESLEQFRADWATGGL
jgi:hypothetical protein